MRSTSLVLCGFVWACSEGATDPNHQGVWSSTQAAISAADEDVDLQSDADAEAQDLQRMANMSGWTLEEAAAQYRVAVAAESVLGALERSRPDVFIAGALSTQPGGSPTLFIKGHADEALIDFLDSSPIDFAISEGHLFSSRELDQITLEFTAALKAIGFLNFGTRVDLDETSVVKATVTLEEGLPASASEILRALPPALMDRVQINTQVSPVAKDESAWGNMLLTPYTCTAGWAVASDMGPDGVVTAGHCGVSHDYIIHPPSTAHNVTYIDAHNGTWGDVGWYTTDAVEKPIFYVDATTTRTVAGTGYPVVNNYVCLYSPYQGMTDCLQIDDATNVSCTLMGITAYNLVELDGDITVGGDSGAAWYYNRTAQGVHKGDCPNNVYSRTDKLFDAIYVLVKEL